MSKKNINICVWCDEGVKVSPIYRQGKGVNLFEVDKIPDKYSGRCLDCWKKDYPTAELKQ